MCKELHCKAADTAVALAWLGWLFDNLQHHDFVWPLSSIMEITWHVRGFLGTVMRAEQYLSAQEWLMAVSCGNSFVRSKGSRAPYHT